MHEVQQCLEYLIKKSEKLPLNQIQKDIIVKDLNYFLTQAKCHDDRRDRSEVISNKWKEFRRKVIRTHLLIEPHGFFQVLSEFIGASNVEKSNSKELERLEKMEVPQFLEDLLLAFEAKRTFFSMEEQDIIYCGLKFLVAESRLPQLKRDEKGILKTWKIIRPKMEKYGLFYRYAGANGLSSKLRFFLMGQL